MTDSTSYISGLSSGLDWSSIVEQLAAVERKPIDLVEDRKEGYEEKLEAWQGFNTLLLSLKSASEGLKDTDDFFLYTSSMASDSSAVEAKDLLSVTTSSSAAPGSYAIQVNTLASAQKLSSNAFTSLSEELGSAYAGDILINGKTVTITEDDTLTTLQNKINDANSGDAPTQVTASIVSYSENDYRLILTSNTTGEEGISLSNASADDILEAFGWKDDSASLKHAVTGGAQSDTFTSTTLEIQTLLGLTDTQSGTVEVNGENVAIDFSSDTLEEIKDKLDSVTGVTATILSDTENGSTSYRIQVDGTQSFSDDQNILETLGILDHGVADVEGTTSGNAMTSGGESITASTLLSDIDGYLSWTSGDTIDIAGTDHDGNAVGDTFTIESSSTVQDFLDAVETVFGDVMAYVTSEGTLEVADMESGTSSLSVSLNSTILDGSSLDWGAFTALDTVRKRELVEGQDASFSVDGEDVTSSDNTVDDVLPGVTLTLKKADAETTVTLSVDRDLDAVKDKISTFVDAYNAVASYISQQNDYDAEAEEKGGALFGDSTLYSIRSSLSSIVTNSVEGVSSDFSTLGLIGVNLDRTGQLSIDDSTLEGYLESNFNDIQKAFSATGSTTTGSLRYISHDQETQAGDYTVNITQIATQSSSTSNTVVSGTLGSDETLTIASNGRTAEVSLTSSMTITDIVNAVNTELDTVYTQQLAGATAVTAGGSAITSSTTWGSIDGGNLVDEDVISFTGIDRSGSWVSGSYTISSTGSDTVQGLLSEIESAYGNEVEAVIDSSGHLRITDKKEGDSSLSITLDYSETTNGVDIFGSVLTSNAGGETGRYAMDITAENNGSDQLLLQHDSYGSDYGFSISETADLLWTTGDQTVDNGQDVSGTINGEAATGSGQILEGDEGAQNVEGLKIKYTGSDTGDVGDVALTLGIGSLFDRELYAITDSYEGYVSMKQESLENTIDRLDSQVERMEFRLESRMEIMINKFVAMETMLSQLQSQSQWLTGQINSLMESWG